MVNEWVMICLVKCVVLRSVHVLFSLSCRLVLSFEAMKKKKKQPCLRASFFSLASSFSFSRVIFR